MKLVDMEALKYFYSKLEQIFTGVTVTIKPQQFTDEQKAQARANIGAGSADFTGDYNDLINKPSVAGQASIGAGKTIKSWSETDGKVAITTQDISITKAQISDFTHTHSVEDITDLDGMNFATEQYVADAIAELPSPMVFKGSLGTDGTITTLPNAVKTNTGFTYKVITDSTYSGQKAKAGDMFISDGSKWVYIPSADEEGGVTSVNVSVPTGLSVSGVPITTSGTIAITNEEGYSIPTNTKQGQWDDAYTHSKSTHARVDATKVEASETNGKIKINGVETNVYTHPTQSAKTNGLYKITVNSTGHVSAANTVTKSDITALGIPAQDTTYESKTAASGGTDLSLVTTGEKYIWNNKQDALSFMTVPSSTNKVATKTEVDGKVPTTRTVNGKALSSNIALYGSDETLSPVNYTKDTENKTITKATTIDKAVAQLEYRTDLKADRTDLLATIVSGNNTSVTNSKTITFNGIGKPLEQLIIEGKTDENGNGVGTIGKNIFDYRAVVRRDGYIVDDNGIETVSTAGSGYTLPTIKVSPSTEYTIQGAIGDVVGVATNAGRIYFYDENKVFISKSGSHTLPFIFNTPKNCKYIGIQYKIENVVLNTIQIEKGATATWLQAYRSTIPVICNSKTYEFVLEDSLHDGDVFSLADGKVIRSDNSIERITIPNINTVSGNNTLTIDTSVVPSTLSVSTFEYLKKSDFNKISNDTGWKSYDISKITKLSPGTEIIQEEANHIKFRRIGDVVYFDFRLKMRFTGDNVRTTLSQCVESEFSPLTSQIRMIRSSNYISDTDTNCLPIYIQITGGDQASMKDIILYPANNVKLSTVSEKAITGTGSYLIN